MEGNASSLPMAANLVLPHERLFPPTTPLKPRHYLTPTSSRTTATVGESDFTETPTTDDNNNNNNNNNNSSSTYHRDESFHASLKRAAAIRRRLSMGGKEHETSLQDLPVARALDAAAAAFRDPTSARRNISFFDAAIDLAVGDATLTPSRQEAKEFGALSLAGSENWSLPELIGVLVNRSRNTIVRQQDEIHCLRLTVKELIQELLQCNDNPRVRGRASTNNNLPNMIEIQKGDNTVEENKTQESLEPTSAHSPTDSAPLSVNPNENPGSWNNEDKEGTSQEPHHHTTSLYASPSTKRNLFARSFLPKDDSAPSSNCQSKEEGSNLQDVTRSLDSTLKAIAGQLESAPISPENSEAERFRAWRENRQPTTPLSEISVVSDEEHGVPTAGKTWPIALQADSSFDDEPTCRSKSPDPTDDHLSTRLLIAENSGRTQGSLIVESILETLIDRSIDSRIARMQLEVSSSTSGEQLVDGAEESDHKKEVTTSVIPAPDKPQSGDNAKEPSRLSVQDPTEKSIGKTKSSDPPGELVDEGSESTRKFEWQTPDEPSPIVTPEESIPSNGHEVQTFQSIPPRVSNFDFSKTEPEPPSDMLTWDQVEEGGYRMAVLYSGSPLTRTQGANQDKALVILHVNGIETELVDGTDPDMAELRDNLFQISGLRGIYPQFFVVNDDGVTSYFGDFPALIKLNDAGQLKSSFLQLGKSSTCDIDSRSALVGCVHQEEKKDDVAGREASQKQPSTPSRSRSESISSSIQSPNKSRLSDSGDDHPEAPQRSDGQSISLVAQLKEELAVPGHVRPVMFVREVEFSLMDPSPIYNVDEAGRLPVIREASPRISTRSPASLLQNIGSDLSSSLEQYTDGEGEEEVRWI